MQTDEKVEESKQKAIADYNHYWDIVSPAERIAGNTPRIYRCRECRWYFAKRRRVKCPVCPSCQSKKVNGFE